MAISITGHTLLSLGVSSHCRMTLMNIWHLMKLKSTEGKKGPYAMATKVAPLHRTELF